MSKSFALLGVFFSLVALFSCKPETPSDILSEAQMEDVLFDFHLAQEMAATSSDVAFNQRTYEEAVFAKHETTKAAFENSLRYYMRHTDKLQEIYENLSERYKSNAELLGESQSDISKYAALSATGDTASIWPKGSTVLLQNHVPFNQNSFFMFADTTFHAGDKLVLSFNANFLFQDGIRNASVMLAARLKNDSVVSTVLHPSTTSRYTLSIKDENRLGIKEIKGYFLLNKNPGPAESSTTLQLLFIEHIQLIRMHETKAEAAKTSGHIPDTLSPASPTPPVTETIGPESGKAVPIEPQGNEATVAPAERLETKTN